MSQFIAEDSKRPKLDVLKMTRAFLEVARYLEDNDDEQITINDLIDFMNQKLLIKLIVTPSPMKTKLQEHFGERLRQRSMANQMLSLSKQQQEWCSRTTTVNTAEEKIQLV